MYIQIQATVRGRGRCHFKMERALSGLGQKRGEDWLIQGASSPYKSDTVMDTYTVLLYHNVSVQRRGCLLLLMVSKAQSCTKICR